MFKYLFNNLLVYNKPSQTFHQRQHEHYCLINLSRNKQNIMLTKVKQIYQHVCNPFYFY